MQSKNLKLKTKKIICISSTSNIIPNPKALGYFSSKFLLKKNFHLLNFNNTNEFKSIILGPVQTKISRNLKKTFWHCRIIYRFLQISSEEAARRIVKFINTSQKTLYVTLTSLVTYYLIKYLLIFMPGLYMKNNRK